MPANGRRDLILRLKVNNRFVFLCWILLMNNRRSHTECSRFKPIGINVATIWIETNVSARWQTVRW